MNKFLSVFIDESGDFGIYNPQAPYYLVAMVLHDQQEDISSEINELDLKVTDLGFPPHAIHTGPIIRNEAYTSQTSPLSREVSKESAQKSNRIKRGLYKDGDKSWNADCVGAYNILKLHLSAKKINVELNPNEVKNPFVAKVAV